MAKLTTWIIIAIFSTIVFYYMVVQAHEIASPNVTCELMNFAENNTAYVAGHFPFVEFIGVYPNSSCTEAYFAGSQYAFTDSTGEVYIYANGTGDFPNSTVGEHYISYDYEATSTVFGLDLAFMGILVILGVGLYLARDMIFK